MRLNLVVQAALAAGLIIIMFGIGLSLTRQDFLNRCRPWKSVFLSFRLDPGWIFEE